MSFPTATSALGGGSDPEGAGPRGVLLLGDKWTSRQAGGLNRYVSGLGAALQDQGVDARAVVLGPAPGAPGWVTADVPDTRRLPSRVLGMAWSAARARAGDDVVDVHFPLYAAIPVLASRLRRCPLVVHFHGPWALESDEAGQGSRMGVLVKRAMERRLQRRAARTVTESAAFKQLLVESYGARPWDIEVVAPGVDLERFSPGGPAARRVLGLAPDRPVVLAVRRLESRMGLALLLRAWARVAPLHPAATLAIAGTGSMAGELEELARALGLAGAVRFLGRVEDDDLATWYRAADFTVVPSTALEGYGLIVLESAASGTPVLVSDIGGLPEAAAGLGQSAVLPAGDVDAWAGRIAAALADPGGLPSEDACRRYAEGFTWEAAARRHLEVYRRAIARPLPKLRVAFVDHCAELSGAELFLLELVDALTGVDTHTILAADGPLAGRLRRQGASVEILEMDRRARELRRGEVRAALPATAVLGTARYVVRLAVRLHRLRPDLVHTNSLKAAIYGGIAGRLAGVPVVWHVHDQLVPEEYPAVARRLVKGLARTVPSGIVANSQSTLDLLGDGLPPAAVVPSIVVRPRPLPARFASAPDQERANLRLGVVGRLAPWKGQDIFLRAFADAFPDGRHRAVVVGGPFFHDHGHEKELHALAERLGLGGRVEFRGHRDDVWSELDRLDVFVHASVTPEPFGRVIVEAMAAGLPVVATRAGGPLELVDDGRTGLLVTPGDVTELSAAMRKLVSSPELRTTLGHAGHEAAGRFGSEVVVDGVVGLYGEVLRGRSRRRRR